MTFLVYVNLFLAYIKVTAIKSGKAVVDQYLIKKVDKTACCACVGSPNPTKVVPMLFKPNPINEYHYIGRAKVYGIEKENIL